ncbi:uncharacterized protein LOC131021798 [Salvia miltiorrhiza]|uniref:uncharacterized protein LOC131021798 n=1 Tax=Salvia miltiorrhiza TaxID=226208 RepID=UPI0025AC0DAC|nr:uncharacterized protein LOC131021798 [Salvia miltiorrhiza]
MVQSLYDEMGSGLQCIKSDSMSQSKEIGSVDNTIFFNGSNATNENNIMGREDFRNINADQIHSNHHQQDAYNLHHHKEACQEPQFDNHLLEESGEDNSHWSLNLQKSSSLWEWDDLLVDENFNFQNLPPL